jgi:hypothetical protein
MDSAKIKAILIPTTAGVCTLPIAIYLTGNHAIAFFGILSVSLAAMGSYILKKTKPEASLKECYLIAVCSIFLVSLPLCLIFIHPIGYYLVYFSPTMIFSRTMISVLIMPLIILWITTVIGNELGYLAGQKSLGEKTESKSTFLLVLYLCIVGLLLFIAIRN